jgi:hypothetical protein
MSPGAEQAMSAIGYVPNGAYLRSDDDKSKSDGRVCVCMCVCVCHFCLCPTPLSALTVNAAILRELEIVLLEKLSDVKKNFNLLPHRLEHEHTYKVLTHTLFSPDSHNYTTL